MTDGGGPELARKPAHPACGSVIQGFGALVIAPRAVNRYGSL